MKRKLISIVMCVLLAFGVVATASACKKAEDPNTIKIFLPFEVVSGYTSYNELSVYQELEKRSGVKVEYTHGVYNDIQQMWTGDYQNYDVMFISDVQVGAGYPGGIEKGIADGVIWDLTEYIEKYAPDYLKTIDESYDSVKKFTKTDSGKMAGIYNIPISEQGPWYGFVVREDWLRLYEEATGVIEKGGELKDLVTYDDWEKFLTYVKDNIHGGKKAPLFLYYTGTDMVGTLNAGYQVSSGLYLKNGNTVTYGATQPEYKQYLDKMRDWYQKGLIDANFYTNNEGTESQMPQMPAMDNFAYDEKALTEALDKQDMAVAMQIMANATYNPAQYAAFPMIYTYIHTYEDLMKNYATFYQAQGKEVYNLRPVAAPKLNASDELHIRYTEKSSAYAVVTNRVKTEEKVKAIVEWFNYLFTDKGSLLMNYGIENDTFTMVDGKPQFTEKITANKEGQQGLSFSDAINKYCSLNFAFKYDWERELQVVNEEEKSAMTEVWNCDNSYVMPTVTLTEAEGRVAEAYELNINKFKDEFTVNYIISKNAPSFEDFVSTLKNTYKVDELVKVYAAAYQRYIAR